MRPSAPSRRREAKGSGLKVSVLIPAYRPTYLAQAIASVLTQGFQDFELLINDDSAGDEVAAVVERFRDPRIRYSRTGGVGRGDGGAENLRQLWRLAGSDLLKYLFDDDILLPHALATLVAQIDAHPEASFAFGHRDVVDAQGLVLSSPRVVAQGKVATLGPADVSAIIVPAVANRIGEYSNVLMNRAVGLTLDDLFVYSGFHLEMLVDVAFYLNASHKGPGIGLGQTLSHFRRHPNQNSNIGFSPIFFKGISEWELFVRGEHAKGWLPTDKVVEAVDKMSLAYRNWGKSLPELHILEAGLPGLRQKVLDGDRDVFDETFRRLWDEAAAAGHERASRQRPGLVG